MISAPDYLGARGVTVNCVGPGPVDTDMFTAGKAPELVSAIAGLHPLKRIPQPEEVAPLVAFLAREEAGWVNGQTIYVNGGSFRRLCVFVRCSIADEAWRLQGFVV